MSIIVRDVSGPNPGQIKLICKGADNMILERLNHHDERNIDILAPTQ
jgi:magnesium-transporting ATPase (P-type)